MSGNAAGTNSYENIHAYTTGLFWVFIFLYFPFMVLFYDHNFTILNFIIYALSLVMVLAGVRSYICHGMGLCSIFLICFYTVLAINCSNLSGIQRPKEISDIWYFFPGPLLFAAILRKADRIRVKRILRAKIVDADIAVVILSAVFWVLQSYLFLTKGIRLFTDFLISSQSAMFTVSGISGLLIMINWIILMLLPALKHNFIKCVAVLTGILPQILNANRTMFMRVAVYLLLYAAYLYGRYIFKKENFLKITVSVAVLLFIFAIWGNYREQTVYSASKDYIGNLLQSKSNSPVINWVYGYTAINFDVLKQKIIGTEPLYSIKAIFIPFIRLFNGSEAAVAVTKGLFANVGNGLHGFNATTFLSAFIAELGALYFLEMVFLGLLVYTLVLFCKAFRFTGGYLYLGMLTAFTIFGNYYIDITSFYSICAGTALSVFIRVYDRPETGNPVFNH